MAQFVDHSVTFLKEVRDEFKKVSRPTFTELRSSTFVVIVAVIMIGIVTGLLDQIFSVAVRAILK